MGFDVPVLVGLIWVVLCLVFCLPDLVCFGFGCLLFACRCFLLVICELVWFKLCWVMIGLVGFAGFGWVLIMLGFAV